MYHVCEFGDGTEVRYTAAFVPHARARVLGTVTVPSDALCARVRRLIWERYMVDVYCRVEEEAPDTNPVSIADRIVGQVMRIYHEWELHRPPGADDTPTVRTLAEAARRRRSEVRAVAKLVGMDLYG